MSLVAAVSVGGWCGVGFAQEDDWEDPVEEVDLDEEQPTDEELVPPEEEEEVADNADTEEEAEQAAAQRLQVAREHRPGFAAYRLLPAERWSPLIFDGGQIYGQIEVDVGYATYKYPERQDRPEEALHDMRGRFVLGPMFQHRLANGLQLTMLAQFVAWVREQEQFYQVNVDDIYAQIGSENWDFQVGRFMTWRVYHKGLGFDIFTLEDQGVNKNYPISNNDFAVHTYEVDYMFLRNSPYVGGEVAGDAALHYYPTDNLGFELAAAYGLAGGRSLNTHGVRLAADLNYEWLRISAAGEYRSQRQTGPPNAVQNAGTPQETVVSCPLCGGSNNYGFGGSAVVTYSPVRVGFDFARGYDETYLNTPDDQGTPGEDPGASGFRMSLGGFAELDIGSLLFIQRPLILGAGTHRTELIRDNQNQEFHYQSAAYIALPLGVNDALAKLVFSDSSADLFNASNPEGTEFIDFHPSSRTVRFRISSNF